MDLFTLSHYLALWGLISYCQQEVWEQNFKSICSDLALIHQHGAFGVWISIVFFPVAGCALTQAKSSLLLVLVSNENCCYLCNKSLQESFSPVYSSLNAFLVKGIDMWVPYLSPLRTGGRTLNLMIQSVLSLWIRISLKYNSKIMLCSFLLLKKVTYIWVS